jgi:hypothetical protein
VNICIPDSPSRLLALIDWFKVLCHESAERGDSWPASLDEWSAMLDRDAASHGRPR